MLMQYKGVTEFAFFNAPRQRVVVQPGDVVDINETVAGSLQRLYPDAWQPFVGVNVVNVPAAVATAVAAATEDVEADADTDEPGAGGKKPRK